MHSLKKIYKSVVYSRRGESLIQAPPESLHAKGFFLLADQKSSKIRTSPSFQTIAATKASRQGVKLKFFFHHDP